MSVSIMELHELHWVLLSYGEFDWVWLSCVQLGSFSWIGFVCIRAIESTWLTCFVLLYVYNLNHFLFQYLWWNSKYSEKTRPSFPGETLIGLWSVCPPSALTCVNTLQKGQSQESGTLVFMLFLWSLKWNILKVKTKILMFILHLKQVDFKIVF